MFCPALENKTKTQILKCLSCSDDGEEGMKDSSGLTVQNRLTALTKSLALVSASLRRRRGREGKGRVSGEIMANYYSAGFNALLINNRSRY
jgi:hypothetical protein